MKSFAKLIEDLGGTTYTCYMELGQPEDISNLYFSKYEIPKDLKILSVGILPYEMLEFIYIRDVRNCQHKIA